MGLVGVQVPLRARSFTAPGTFPQPACPSVSCSRHAADVRPGTCARTYVSSPPARAPVEGKPTTGICPQDSGPSRNIHVVPASSDPAVSWQSESPVDKWVHDPCCLAREAMGRAPTSVFPTK
jgi:hypothetical protein